MVVRTASNISACIHHRNMDTKNAFSVYSRIEKDDTGIAQLLHCFTLAQITEFLKIAEENDCTNVKALLLDFKNQNYADFDPMEKFALEG